MTSSATEHPRAVAPPPPMPCALPAPAPSGAHSSFPIGVVLGMVVACVVSILAVGWMRSAIDLSRAPRLASAAFLLVWAVAIGVDAWAFTAGWRAATRTVQAGGRQRWMLVARGAVAAAVLAVIASMAVDDLPHVTEALRLATGSDPRGQVQAQVSPDGRRLALRGWLGLGDAARVRRVLSAAPDVSLVELDLAGGRVGEGVALAGWMHERGLVTRATGRCAGACTLVFLGGRERQVSPGGGLGFARLADDHRGAIYKWRDRRDQEGLYRQAGVEDHFIDRVLSASLSSPWLPDYQDLTAGRVVNVPPRPLDVDIPGAAHADEHDDADALRTNPVWLAIDRRFPGTVDAAASRIQAARMAGASEEVALVDGQQQVFALFPTLASTAGVDMLVELLPLLDEQLKAAQPLGRRACGAVLSGDAAIRHQLPESLAQREATWWVDAATEPVDAARPNRATRLEIEVVRRSMGASAPALLAALWQPGAGDRDADCAQSIALLDAALALPLPERRLAAKLIFGHD